MDIVKDADGPARRPSVQADLAATAVSRTAFVPLLGLGVAFYALCLHVAEVDVLRLWEGLPRLAGWIEVENRTLPPSNPLEFTRSAESTAEVLK